MNSLRLTAITFILGLALVCVMAVGWRGVAAPTLAVSSEPIVNVAAFAPAGLKKAPWEGEPEAKAPAAKVGGKAGGVGNIVVVELFTSEGCSSCPPADKVLSDLAERHGADVWFFPLTYHVDYWDYLGWKDRFADAAYTRRQREYAATFADKGVYTPQLVVNGEKGFVGSDRAKADAAIKEARGRAGAAGAAGAVTVSATIGAIKAGETIKVEMTIAAGSSVAAPDVQLVACLVEDGLKSKVTAGENQGRELHHDRVVRAMADAAAGKDGRAAVELRVPGDAKAEKCRVVVMAQKEGGRVVGAAVAASTSKP